MINQWADTRAEDRPASRVNQGPSQDKQRKEHRRGHLRKLVKRGEWKMAGELVRQDERDLLVRILVEVMMNSSWLLLLLP